MNLRMLKANLRMLKIDIRLCTTKKTKCFSFRVCHTGGEAFKRRLIHSVVVPISA